MATIINASNSTGLTLTSDLSGVLQLQQNGVALPALSVAPAFSVYASGSQTIPSGTGGLKVLFDTKEFDTNTNFSTSTGRFTPTVAGYYQITWGLYTTTGSSNQYVMIYKNGALYKETNYQAAYPWVMSTGGVLVSMNGSSDYIEIYFIQPAGGTLGGGQPYTYLQGFLARGA
jgi:hypothetical protein